MERTCAWLVPWVAALPPGSRTAGEYLYDTGFSTTSSAARRTMVKIAASCPALQPQTSSLCRGGGLPGGGVSIFPNRGRVRQVFADNNTMRRPASGAPAVQAASSPAQALRDALVHADGGRWPAITISVGGGTSTRAPCCGRRSRQPSPARRTNPDCGRLSGSAPLAVMQEAQWPLRRVSELPGQCDASPPQIDAESKIGRSLGRRQHPADR